MRPRDVLGVLLLGMELTKSQAHAGVPGEVERLMPTRILTAPISGEVDGLTREQLLTAHYTSTARLGLLVRHARRGRPVGMAGSSVP